LSVTLLANLFTRLKSYRALLAYPQIHPQTFGATKYRKSPRPHRKTPINYLEKYYISITHKGIHTNLSIIHDSGHREPWIIAMSKPANY